MQTEPQGQPESFTCPDCGMVSHNPNDIAYAYCGRCHTFPEQRIRKSTERFMYAIRDRRGDEAYEAFMHLADVSRRAGTAPLSPWERFSLQGVLPGV